MTQSILYRANYGVPGDLSRNTALSRVEPQAMGATAFGAYGIAVKLVAGLLVPLATAGDSVYGFLVRPYPATGNNASDPIGTAVPPAPGVGGIQQLSVLVAGYMTVYVQEGAGSVAAGGAVYVRYAASGNLVIGGIGGAAIASNNVALTSANSRFGGAFFTGACDASGNAEIAFNL